MHFSMRITIRIICVLMRIPKHFSKCVSHAHCMRFRNAHYGKRIRSASDAFQKCASWLSHFMRIWKRIWNASVMRIKRFKWNGLMRFQMRINVHRGESFYCDDFDNFESDHQPYEHLCASETALNRFIWNAWYASMMRLKCVFKCA